MAHEGIIIILLVAIFALIVGFAFINGAILQIMYDDLLDGKCKSLLLEYLFFHSNT